MSEIIPAYPVRRADDRVALLEEELRQQRGALLAHLEQERQMAVTVAGLVAEVRRLADSLARIEVRDADQQKSLTVLNELLSQARGALRVLVWIGAVAGALWAAGTWLVDHLHVFGGGK